jgi:hypothetical protein
MSTTVGNLSVELGISDDQLRAGLAAAVVQAQQAGQKISQGMNQASAASQKTGANMNMAILQASRGIQDFQAAGLMGIVNNVEGIATAFGMGAGVAGMVTLAAVAIQSLSPIIQTAAQETAKFFGLWRSETDMVKTSVSNFMGAGSGNSAMADALKTQIEFLKSRDDNAGGILNNAIRVGNFLADPFNAYGGDEAAKAMQNNMRRGIEATALMSQAFEQSAMASKELAAAQRGATAKYDLTTAQQEQTKLNQQLFQSAINASGGGENLRTRIEMAGARQGMIKTDARELYGKFATGDIAATAQVEQMLNLTAEKAKIMADDWERVTGAAAELRNIEEETRREAAAAFEQETDSIYKSIVEGADKAIAAQKSKDRLIGDEIGIMVKDELERQALTAKASEMESNLADLEARRMRSEIIGSSDVFMRNFNAGLEKDPTVLAIEKQTEDLKEVMESLKELN